MVWNGGGHSGGGFGTRSGDVLEWSCLLRWGHPTWTSFSLRSTLETIVARSPLSGLELVIYAVSRMAWSWGLIHC